MSERKGLLLDCSVGAKEIRSEGDQEIEVRQARLDRQRVRNHERRAAEQPVARLGRPG